MSEDIGFVPYKVGRYWDRSGKEIDVVALDPDRKLAFVDECKFRTGQSVDGHDLNNLISKISTISELEGYEMTYGLFSVSGFDQATMDPDEILIDKEKVVKKGR